MWAGRTRQIVVKKASATSDYSVTDEQIKLSKMEGKLFGGSFSGDAQIDNWLHSIPLPAGESEEEQRRSCGHVRGSAAGKKGEKAKLPGIQSGAVHLRLRDFSAARDGGGA